MIKLRALPKAPILSFDPTAKRWRLDYQDGDQQGAKGTHGSDRSFFALISFCYCDGSTFRFYCSYGNGEVEELVTKEQMDERYEAIALNEGDEVAELWRREQTEWHIVNDDHFVYGLRDHWNAMISLGLFAPMVTWESGEMPTRLDPELRAKMDALRHDLLLRELEEFKEVAAPGEG